MINTIPHTKWFSGGAIGSAGNGLLLLFIGRTIPLFGNHQVSTAVCNDNRSNISRSPSSHSPLFIQHHRLRTGSGSLRLR